MAAWISLTKPLVIAVAIATGCTPNSPRSPSPRPTTGTITATETATGTLTSTTTSTATTSATATTAATATCTGTAKNQGAAGQGSQGSQGSQAPVPGCQTSDTQPPPTTPQVPPPPPPPTQAGRQPTDDPYFVQEVAALRQRTPHSPPTMQQLRDLVAAGIPKPPDPRNKPAHDALMQWGQDAMTEALLMRTASSVDQTQSHSARLKAILNFWSNAGTNFGDSSDTANYGNSSLELTWMLGNLVRAAVILRADSQNTRSAAFGSFSDAEAAAFRTWAQAIAKIYIDFGVFSTGQTNRKASQIYTLMRVAELDGTASQTSLTSLFAALQDLIRTAIDAQGTIPADSVRDKYHPQFFLAAALQALAVAERHGLKLDPANSTDAVALNRLAAAIEYAAATNRNDLPPPEYPKIGDPVQNHEIPFWFLAANFLTSRGLSKSANVDFMVSKNYEKVGNFSFVMDWGFSAIATYYGI